MIDIQTRELLGRDKQRQTFIRYGKPRIRTFKSEEALNEWSDSFGKARNGDWVANWERFEIRRAIFAGHKGAE
jgi:hypothetical protein